MNKLTSKNGALLYRFDSVAQITEYVLPEVSERFFNGRDVHRFIGRELSDWEQTQLATKQLWQEGIDILLASVERLKKEAIPEIKSRQRKTQFNDGGQGEEFDYERFMAGECAWRSSVREETHGTNEVTIITDTTTEYRRHSEDILWRGAVAIALTSILEQKGYRVELWVVNGTRLFVGESTPVCTACCLKKTSDPLDTSTLVNTVSGWFYRTATFSLLESICKREGKRAHHSLGMCYIPKPAELDLISVDANRIYSSGAYSFNGAINQVLAELEQFKPKDKTQ